MDGTQKRKLCVSTAVGLVLGVLLLTLTIVAVDNTSPIITVYSPQNTTYFSSNIPLKVTANEFISTWWYSLNGGTNITFTPNITLTGLSDGQNNIRVYANDSAGNVGTNFLPAVEWNKTFGGPSGDFALSVKQTSDGGYVLGGWTSSFGEGQEDFWLVKTGPLGNIEWDKPFGGTGRDFGWSVDETFDGGFVIAGRSLSFGAGGEDFWLIKVDSNGNHIWNKTFGGPSQEGAYSVTQTSDKGYVIAGYTWSYTVGGQEDFWLVKTDVNGSLEWQNSFGGADYDKAWSVQQTNDGGYVLTGYTRSFGAGKFDFWLVKTDSSGNLQWERTFGGPENDVAYSAQQTFDGGYIIAGYTYSYGAGDADFWIVKTDSSGNMEWNRAFGGIDLEFARSVHQNNDKSFVITGFTESFGSGQSDVWLVKIDLDGSYMWDKTFGDAGLDWAWDVTQTSDDRYIIAGKSSSGNEDFWLIKIKSETGPFYFSVEPIPITTTTTSSSTTSPTSTSTTTTSTLQKPRIVVLANSIDYGLAGDFFGFLENNGMEVVHVTIENYEPYRNENLIILGGPDAPEGVGELVRDILSVSEQEEIRESGARRMYVKLKVWEGDKVIVIAGSDRWQTKAAHQENPNEITSEIES